MAVKRPILPQTAYMCNTSFQAPVEDLSLKIKSLEEKIKINASLIVSKSELLLLFSL